jgi:hypothetical protein
MFLMSSIIVELNKNMTSPSQKQMRNSVPKDTFSGTRCGFKVLVLTVIQIESVGEAHDCHGSTGENHSPSILGMCSLG